MLLEILVASPSPAPGGEFSPPLGQVRGRTKGIAGGRLGEFSPLGTGPPFDPLHFNLGLAGRVRRPLAHPGNTVGGCLLTYIFTQDFVHQPCAAVLLSYSLLWRLVRQINLYGDSC